MLPKLGDGLATHVQSEPEATQPVADKAGHAADLGSVMLGGFELQKKVVRGQVGLLGRVKIVLHLVEVADLELVAHHQQMVGVLVQRVLNI